MMKSFLMLVAACLLLPASVQAEGLGRLFFTPEQRAQLDQHRLQNTSSSSSDGSSVLTVNGIVQKHGGGRTVWINGVPHAAGKSDDDHPATVPVTIPGKSDPVKVKVGQKLLLEEPAE